MSRNTYTAFCENCGRQVDEQFAIISKDGVFCSFECEKNSNLINNSTGDNNENTTN